MIFTFIKRLAAAVVASHIAIAAGLHFYRKKKQPHGFQKRTEEDKLLSWLTKLDGVPLIKDIAANTKKLDTFTVRDSDVYIASYPKSGTTWMSEIIYNIIHDMDFVKARSASLDDRVPYMEWVHTDKHHLQTMSHDHPRILKTHLPFPLLPSQLQAPTNKCKIIYIMRNPRDVCVSYYYFTKMIQPVGYNGEFAGFFELFHKGEVAYGQWSSHIKPYWNESCRADNVLFITYEELIKKPIETINKVAEFLGKSLPADRVRILNHYCSFQKMRENSASNYDWLEESEFKIRGVPFLRKGVIGDWKNHLSSEMIKRLDEEIVNSIDNENLLDLVDYESIR